METSQVQVDASYIFKPTPNMVGWTIDRWQEFKHNGVPPTQFAGRLIKVMYYDDSHECFAVHFQDDTEDDHFYCCASFFEPAGCLCSSRDLFNYGCRCARKT